MSMGVFTKFCICHGAGEGAGLVTTQPKSAQILSMDIPFDGLGLISIPASETISPVFTMWITLVAMYTGTQCHFVNMRAAPLGQTSLRVSAVSSVSNFGCRQGCTHAAAIVLQAQPSSQSGTGVHVLW